MPTKNYWYLLLITTFNFPFVAFALRTFQLVFKLCLLLLSLLLLLMLVYVSVLFQHTEFLMSLHAITFKDLIKGK